MNETNRHQTSASGLKAQVSLRLCVFTITVSSSLCGQRIRNIESWANASGPVLSPKNTTYNRMPGARKGDLGNDLSGGWGWGAADKCISPWAAAFEASFRLKSTL